LTAPATSCSSARPNCVTDWEWGHLLYLCHQDILSIPAHTNRPRERFFGGTQLIGGLAFDSTGRRLVTYGHDASLKVWELSEGRLEFALDDPSNRVTAWAWHPSAEELVAGTTNGVVRVFDAKTWRELRSWAAGMPGPAGTAAINLSGQVGRAVPGAPGAAGEGPPAPPAGVPALQAPSPVGRERDGVRVSSPAAPSGVTLRQGDKPQRGPLTGLAFDPRGRCLVTVVSNQHVAVWEPTTVECLWAITNHAATIASA